MDTTRDPAIDAYRAMALAAVVLGHWLLTVTWWSNGRLEAHNLLDVAPWTQWATWALQPVPLFFVVGGWAGARSWRRARSTTCRTAWLAARLERLLAPVCTFTCVALVGAAALKLVAPGQVGTVARLLGMPLWFLAVYVPVTAAMPLLVDLVDRWGWRVPRDLAVAAVGVDLCRFGGHLGGVGWMNFAFVWLCCAAVGVAAESRPPSRRAIAGVGLASVGALVATVRVGWYPVSMVGVGDRSNNTPPTFALLLLGVAHAGLAGLAAPALRRRLARNRRAARSVGLLGAFGMHLYLWHLTATVAIVALQQQGIGNLRPLTGGWWAARPLWVGLLAVVAAPVVIVAARVDQRRLQMPSQVTTSAKRVGLAVVASTVGLTVLALRGFGLGPVALGAVAGIQAAALLVVERRRDAVGRPDASELARLLVVGEGPRAVPSHVEARHHPGEVHVGPVPGAGVDEQHGVIVDGHGERVVDLVRIPGGRVPE
jgi:hypothetical protein